MTRLPSFFITGTDTGVGKTVITGLLAWLYQEAGIRVGISKPVITGVDKCARFSPGSDLFFLKNMLITGLGPVNSYCFTEPVSPHLAAANDGITIDPACIEADHRSLAAECEATITEGAGGLLVPLGDNLFMADLAIRLKLPLIIVSRPSLGTINHTLLTVSHAKGRGIPVIGIIINNYPANPNPAEADNPKAIEKFGSIPVLAIVPHMSGVSVEKGYTGEIRDVAQAVEKEFNLLDRLSMWRKKNV